MAARTPGALRVWIDLRQLCLPCIVTKSSAGDQYGTIGRFLACIRKLENVQRSFTRKIADFSELQYWDRLKKLMLRQRGQLDYSRMENSHAPNNLGLEFISQPRRSSVAIPSTNKSAKPLCNNSLTVKVAQLFNVLPTDIRSITLIGSLLSWRRTHLHEI